MKNKIVYKLVAYFTAALLIFAIAISGIFFSLFRSHTIELHKEELKQRAIKISETLSSLGNNGTGMGMGRGGGYGAYVRFLSDIAMSDVWIVDENLDILTGGMMHPNVNTTAQLPPDAGEIVAEVFDGNTEFSESFSSVLDTPTLTVGTPIKRDGAVIGAVLLHAPVQGIDTAISKGFTLLMISMGIALLIAIMLSIGFSITFTRPLKQMNTAAIRLAAGDYTIKTDIRQRDEIGTLAGNLDILSERLDQSSRESERMEQMRRDFVANVSHELKTPITVIRGSLEALRDGVVTGEAQVREYYEQMLGESKNLQRLVGDLLDLSRLQNTDFQLEMGNISLCDVVSDAVRSARGLAQQKGVELILENNGAGCTVWGDYGRLRQMILIIVDNAIKFSPRDGRVYITLSQDGDITLSIRDQGKGIPQRDLPYIFDRFYKTKSPENETGTGLGLAIAKEIALRHGAKLQAFSEEGRGSEFVLTIKEADSV